MRPDSWRWSSKSRRRRSLRAEEPGGHRGPKRRIQPITTPRRITDHRSGLTVYNGNLLDRDIDEMIDALITTDQAEKLRAE